MLLKFADSTFHQLIYYRLIPFKNNIFSRLKNFSLQFPVESCSRVSVEILRNIFLAEAKKFFGVESRKANENEKNEDFLV